MGSHTSEWVDELSPEHAFSGREAIKCYWDLGRFNPKRSGNIWTPPNSTTILKNVVIRRSGLSGAVGVLQPSTHNILSAPMSISYFLCVGSPALHPATTATASDRVLRSK